MPIIHLRLDTHFRDYQKNDSKCQKNFLLPKNNRSLDRTLCLRSDRGQLPLIMFL
jgi:hypothetical protein